LTSHRSKALETFAGPVDVNDSSETPHLKSAFDSPVTTPAFTVPTNLLKRLLDIKYKKIGMKILQNVILAAVALAWIRSAPFERTMGSMQRVIKDSDLQLPDASIASDIYVICET
jgi:hypothetical protein